MTYPLATLAPTVDLTGISSPSYNDIYQSLIASFQAIYGTAIYIAPDSQDGQWIAVLARAIYDSNQAAVAVFQAFAPGFAQGTGLSAVVKINGLQRNIASNSTAVGNVIGQAGTVITNGVVQDVNGNKWDLPALVIIPGGGSIAVTVTAEVAGSLAAPSGTINKIVNPQLGWQSFASTANATPGSPVESDAALRVRQTASVALPALGIKAALYAVVGNTPGVTRWTVYENDTSSADSNSIPAHSICVVALGGTVTAVAAAIASKKPPGIQTYGTTSQTVYDSVGLPSTINFDVLTIVPIYFAVTIKALPGYLTTTTDAIKAAIAAFVNALAIGEDVYVSQASAAASLIALGAGQSFYVTAFALGTAPAPSGTTNITIAFNAAASCDVANIAVSVT